MATRTRNGLQKRDDSRQKIVTLADVAELAGVTPMTVSRVIKNNGYVAAATREKVLRIAEELNYTANLAARALATGKTGSIAVISGKLNEHYYANIVHLLETQLTASGYQMRLLHTHAEVKDLINSTNASAVDGVIVAGMYHLVEEFQALDPRHFQPCVFIDTVEHQEADHIYSRLGPAVSQALQMMLDAGRSRIAYVGLFFNPEDLSGPMEVRMRTYWETMKSHGREPEVLSSYPVSNLSSSQRINAIKEYLQANGCPDAFLCINDETAILVYRALMDLGYRVPDDVLLVGCDGLSFMECFEPPLSTISQPLEEICALAWKFLLERISNPDTPLQSASFDASLVVRKSMVASPLNATR